MYSVLGFLSEIAVIEHFNAVDWGSGAQGILLA